MKSIKKPGYILVYTILSISLVNCKKELNSEDLNRLHPKILSIKGNGTGYNSNSSNAVFAYDSKGNPDSIIYARVTDGMPNLKFRYDNKQHLTDAIGFYNTSNNGSFEEWHRYNYNKKGQVIIDTVYYGSGYVIVNGLRTRIPGATVYQSISYLSYDNFNRITKDSNYNVINNIDFSKVQNYYYDAQGNLIGNGLTYDNNINPHQLSSVWQLLDRDYSLNNPYKAASYNKYSLPTSFGNINPIIEAPPYYRFLFQSRGFDKTDITYDLK